MYAPGVVGIAVGLLILLIMKDSPESIGYPPIEPKQAPKGASPDGCMLVVMSVRVCLLSLSVCACADAQASRPAC